MGCPSASSTGEGGMGQDSSDVPGMSQRDTSRGQSSSCFFLPGFDTSLPWSVLLFYHPNDPIQVLAASPHANKPHGNNHTGISFPSFCFTGKIRFVGLVQNVRQSCPKYCRGMGNKFPNSWSLSWSWITLCSRNKTSFMSLIQALQKPRKYLNSVSLVFSSWSHLSSKAESCQYLQLK